jgi:DNA-binding response OmpR family regulator
VDDEPHLRQMMRLTLETTGYDVDEAANGEHALAQFREGSGYDAVLLDQRMPGLDGLETLRRVKQDHPDIVVIMVTAYATIDLAIDAMKVGASDFVRKPMTPETLRHAVAAALSKRGGVAAVAPTAPAGAAAVEIVPPPREIWTTNGFFVRRAERQSNWPETDHHFVVRRGSDLTGTELVVSIEPRIITRAARDGQRTLNPAGTFWQRQAENALLKYLWSEAQLPPDGRLALDAVSGAMIDELVDWSGD